MDNLPFVPGGTISISASGTTARGMFSNAAATTFRIANAVANTIFFKTGDSTVTATTSDTPILGGTTEVFSKSTSDTHIAVITASATGTVYATSGYGS